MGSILEKAFSLAKSLYVNLKCFKFSDAIKLPILVNYRVKTKGLYKGCIDFKSQLIFGSLRLAMGPGSFNMQGNSSITFSKFGKLVITDKAYFASGCKIFVGGNIRLGRNFGTNANALITCENSIKIGDNIAVGWNCTIIDADGHPIYVDGKRVNESREIYIGDNVWLCANSTVLKGSFIANGSIVAYGSCISDHFDEKNVIIAGTPGKIVKKNVHWEK
jgi:acetyltransferase-like isoleucine patch superfamily enzyme